MKKSEVLFAIGNFKKVFLSLKQACETAKTDLEKDGTLQRFEFTFELFWKTIKIVLEYHGKIVNNPRSAIKEGFKTGFIDDDEIYLDMLEDRNKSSHIYDENTSNEIFDRIKNFYIKAFEKFLKNIDKI